MNRVAFHKIIALVLSVLLVASMLGACGSDNSAESTKPKDTQASNTQQEVPSESTKDTVPETSETVPATSAVTHDGPVHESAKVDGSYFDDAVFVGDSVSLKLSYYEAAVDLLGKAQFLTSGSLGSANALWDISDESVHPTYNGTKMRLEDSIPQTGAKKLYIMLGMNDIALYGVDEAVSNMETLIGNILNACPGMTVYIQSMTPITSTSALLSDSGHNPQLINAYNEKLLEMAVENGWHYVNVAEVMFDADGYLRREYCSDPDDMGIHFTNEGCGVWIEYLRTHTCC